MNEAEEHLKAFYAHKPSTGAETHVLAEFQRNADKVRAIREDYNRREADIRKNESERRRKMKA